MPEPARGPAGPSTQFARKLLLGGLAGGHLAWLIAIIGFWVGAGRSAGLSAVLAGAVVVGFFAIGGAVLAAVADRPPELVLMVALASYLVRVIGVGVLLWFALLNTERLALVKSAVVATTISVVLCWVIAEVWTFTRLRIPIFDSNQ